MIPSINTLEDFINFYEKSYKCFVDLYNEEPDSLYIVEPYVDELAIFLSNSKYSLRATAICFEFEETEIFNFLNSRFIFEKLINVKNFDKTFRRSE